MHFEWEQAVVIVNGEEKTEMREVPRAYEN